MRKHHKITLSALALLAALAFFAEPDRPNASGQAQPIVQVEAPQREAARPLVASLPVRAEMPELRGDPFSLGGAMNPSQRASRARAAAPASAPIMAANPYRFAGELRQPGATRRYLVRGDDIVEVKAGDVLEDGYRVDALAENEVVLVHLASGVRHSVARGTATAPAAATPAAAALGAPSILLGAPGQRTPPRALRES